MTPITTSKGEFLHAEVPEDATDIKLDSIGISYFISATIEGNYWFSSELPPGSYTLLATRDTMTEEKAGMAVDRQRGSNGKYKDYTIKGSLRGYGTFLISTATESHRTLLESYGINPDINYALLMKNK